ncbi:MAG TPA: transposase [Desulfobacterales bacterium]|nr:transposase [Desulfobacterales bacterium]
MSTIPTSVTEEQFNKQIVPYLSTAKRGFVCQIPLYKVFNYILYRLHTGCQWKQLPTAPDPNDGTKKKSVGKPCTTTFASGALTGAWPGSGRRVSKPCNATLT